MGQHRSKSIVQEKSFRFAVDIVTYARRHQNDRINLVLTRQLLRSETSIGANIEDALGGQSRDALKTMLNSIILTTRSTLVTQHSEPRIQNP